MIEAVEIEAEKRMDVLTGDLRHQAGNLRNECCEENAGSCMPLLSQPCVEEYGGNGDGNAIQDTEPNGIPAKQDAEGQNSQHDKLRAPEKPGDRL